MYRYSRARIHWQTMSVSRQHFNLSCEQEKRGKLAGKGGKWAKGQGKGLVQGAWGMGRAASRRRCPGLLHGLPSICPCALPSDNHGGSNELGALSCRKCPSRGLSHRTGFCCILCCVAGNVLFQLRFAEMQLKTCNLFDVSVFFRMNL